MKILLLSAALIAAPALAQQQRPSVEAIASAPVDPARLALARTAVDSVWPIGTYERMMRSTMDGMIDRMMDSMMDIKLDDVLAAEARAKDPKLAGRTLREAMAKQDPHFLERMSIMTRVMSEEMIPIANRYEPNIREAIVRVYAGKYTAAQLEDLNRFFATPTGKLYAPDAMMALMEPQVLDEVSKLTPELVREMPRIMEKVRAATAHLAPPLRASGSSRR